ncbi:toxin-antitoxin system, toxin component family protein [Streptomyces sp. CRN 30]|uniref:toxin-antitoxin system, toxin component family protein n=1 Tax=Streptomyces sp. CRN 30 TaxID=3075613 RepID=UPI002A8384A1|nr:toxin-antitoxin system, toxin component family protein [Streptomyces sp. CRN 30]
MDVAGVRRQVARAAATLGRSRNRSARRLATGLAAGLRARPHPPRDVRALCRALCEEMSARRGGRPVVLRFECFPDELEVTGLWVEFHDHDLVIVERRAEEVQQLVILGHELWHIHAGHRHHRAAGRAAARALTGTSDWRDSAVAVATRNGSRAADEADADAFGYRLASVFRHCLTSDALDPPPGPLQRSLGYLGRGSGKL